MNNLFKNVNVFGSVDLTSKLYDYKFVLLLAVFALQANLYMLWQHKANLSQLNVAFNEIADFGKITFVFLATMIFYSIITRILRTLGELFLIYAVKPEESRIEGYHTYKDLKEKAIKENNAVMFTFVEEKETVAKNTDKTIALIVTIAILLIIDQLFGEFTSATALCDTYPIAFNSIAAITFVASLIGLIFVRKSQFTVLIKKDKVS